MKKNLLILIPINSTLHPHLKRKALQLVNALFHDEQNNSLFNIKVETHVDKDKRPKPPWGGKFWHHARVRNHMIETCLDEWAELVMWIDADLVDYPTNLPALLYGANPLGVTAPAVLIEGFDGRFYDTLGFVENGARTSASRPYFSSSAELVELDSVGCCYLTPALLFKSVIYDSEKYDGTVHHHSIAATGHTEHWPVMQEAKRMGMKVACLQNVHAHHAHLPKYGEAYH